MRQQMGKEVTRLWQRVRETVQDQGFFGLTDEIRNYFLWHYQKLASKALVTPPLSPPQPVQQPVELPSEPIVSTAKLYSYDDWIIDNEPTLVRLQEQIEQSTLFSQQPLYSFIIPVYNPPVYALQAAIESVQGQTYPTWELCLANGGDDLNVRNYLDQVAAQDVRIKVRHLGQNLGISGNSNQALKLATGDFIALLDHDDTVAPNQLFEVTTVINQNPTLDIIYFDEDKLSADGKERRDPWMKPGWSPDMMLTVNLLGHAIFRRALVVDVGEFDPLCDGSQDWDLGLRCIERTQKIYHIPKILYHWRMIPGSASVSIDAKPWAYLAQERALTTHLARMGEPAQQATSIPGKGITLTFQADLVLVSMIIPTKDNVNLLRRCIDSLLHTTRYPHLEIVLVDTGSEKAETVSYYQEISRHENIRIINYVGDFNFSKANNLGAANANGEMFLFLNNDTEAIDPDWLEIMVGWCMRKSIGVVGAKLLYPDQHIQHAGVILSMSGHADHIYWGMQENGFGVFGSTEWVRNYLAVTGAFQMMRRQVFEEIGGFDEAYELCFSDIELCLRVFAHGYRNLYLPFVRFYHHEGASRGGKIPQADVLLATKHFAHYIVNGDPYFSPNLSYASRQPRLLNRAEVNRVQQMEKVLQAFHLPDMQSVVGSK